MYDSVQLTSRVQNLGNPTPAQGVESNVPHAASFQWSGGGFQFQFVSFNLNNQAAQNSGLGGYPNLGGGQNCGCFFAQNPQMLMLLMLAGLFLALANQNPAPGNGAVDQAPEKPGGSDDKSPEIQNDDEFFNKLKQLLDYTQKRKSAGVNPKPNGPPKVPTPPKGKDPTSPVPPAGNDPTDPAPPSGNDPKAPTPPKGKDPTSPTPPAGNEKDPSPAPDKDPTAPQPPAAPDPKPVPAPISPAPELSQDAVNSAEASVDIAGTALNDAKSTLNDASTAMSAASQSLAQAQQAFDGLGPDASPELRQKAELLINQAKANYDSAQQALSKGQKNVADAEKYLQEAQAALEKAKTEKDAKALELAEQYAKQAQAVTDQLASDGIDAGAGAINSKLATQQALSLIRKSGSNAVPPVTKPEEPTPPEPVAPTQPAAPAGPVTPPAFGVTESVLNDEQIGAKTDELNKLMNDKNLTSDQLKDFLDGLNYGDRLRVISRFQSMILPQQRAKLKDLPNSVPNAVQEFMAQVDERFKGEKGDILLNHVLKDSGGLDAQVAFKMLSSLEPHTPEKDKALRNFFQRLGPDAPTFDKYCRMNMRDDNAVSTLVTERIRSLNLQMEMDRKLRINNRAQQIHDALDGCKDPNAVLEAIKTMPKEELAQLRSAYADRYQGHKLENDIISNLGDVRRPDNIPVYASEVLLELNRDDINEQAKLVQKMLNNQGPVKSLWYEQKRFRSFWDTPNGQPGDVLEKRYADVSGSGTSLGQGKALVSFMRRLKNEGRLVEFNDVYDRQFGDGALIKALNRDDYYLFHDWRKEDENKGGMYNLLPDGRGGIREGGYHWMPAKYLMIGELDLLTEIAKAARSKK